MAIPSETGTGGAGRLAALSGLVFVVLVVVSFAALGGDTPGSEDSGAVIDSFYSSHQGREFAASFVLAASAPFVVLFGIVLALAVWPAEGSRRALWPLGVAIGGGVAGMAFLLVGLLHFALTDAADQSSVSGATLQALNALDSNAWVAFNGALGVMMLAAAACLLPRAQVLGWIALIAGIALFIPFADFFALIVTGLWIIFTSVQLFRRGPAFVAAATPA